MAAVRNCPAVVYDLEDFIEQQAGDNAGHSWLARSFRAAEQFVLTRAGAVVVHSAAAYNGVLERGAAPETAFVVPTPLAPEMLDALRQPLGTSRHASDSDVTFFAPAPFDGPRPRVGLENRVEKLLTAFASLNADGVNATLYLPVLGADASELLDRARALSIAERVHAIAADDYQHALELADILILESEAAFTVEVCRALAAGCAVLAEDAGADRNLAYLPSGVVWYSAADNRDLARRAALLAGNPDLRRSLAQSARSQLADSRSPEAIGRLYDRIYECAWRNRRTGGTSTIPGAMPEPLQQAG